MLAFIITKFATYCSSSLSFPAELKLRFIKCEDNTIHFVQKSLTRYRHVQIFENYVLVTTLIDTCMNKEYKQYWIDFIQCISFSFALTVRPIFSSILMSSS